MSIMSKIQDWKKRQGKAEALSVEDMAETMVEDAARAAARAFDDKDFRKYADWEEMTEDRNAILWNELLAMAMCTALYAVEESIQYLPGDKREYWRAVRVALPEALWALLKSAGITKENLDGWQQFLAMRQDVVRVGQEEVAGMFGSKMRGLRTPDREMNVRVAAIATACHMDIRPPGSEPIRELNDYLHAWVGEMDHACQLRMQRS